MKALPWILCAVLLGVLVWQRFGGTPERHETVWDTIPVYDTITHDSVVPRDSVVLRYEVVKLPVAGNIDTGNIPDDSVAVSVPITQKHYQGDDYEAWVSGFRARLDSIRMFPKSYYLKPKEMKPKRWVLSAGVSAGWNPFTRKFEPTIGINIGLKLWEW